MGQVACPSNGGWRSHGGCLPTSWPHLPISLIDTWYIFSIARGEELRPFSTCVRRCRTMFDIVEHDRVTGRIASSSAHTPSNMPPIASSSQSYILLSSQSEACAIVSASLAILHQIMF